MVDRKEELLVEVSQKREVQQSRRGRVGGAAPAGPGPVVWLASWHKQSSNIFRTKTKVGPFHHEERYIYIYIYNILSTQTEWRQGPQLDLLLWREKERC